MRGATRVKQLFWQGSFRMVFWNWFVSMFGRSDMSVVRIHWMMSAFQNHQGTVCDDSVAH
jgi:hypothetical protein